MSLEEVKITPEERKFLYGYLQSGSNPSFNTTLENLSAFIAYRSLPKEKGLEYATYSSCLDPTFFLLEDRLEKIERELPPYENLIRDLYDSRGISKEELQILCKKPPRFPLSSEARRLTKEKSDIIKKYNLLPPEEYQAIVERYQEKIQRGSGKLLLPFYALTSASILLSTQNPLAVASWLSTGVLPYYGFKKVSQHITNKKIRRWLDTISTIYFFSKSPVGAIETTLEFGLGSPLAVKGMEKFWPYFPRFLRKGIFKTENFLSGIKEEKFDEKEIRKRLCEIEVKSSSIPNEDMERFKAEVENGMIEIENLAKILLRPFDMSYHRRRVVAVPEGKNMRIVDRKFIKRLADLEGTTEEDVESKVRRNPEKYLGIDLKGGKLVFTRDIIGILSCQLSDALLIKEKYVCALGKKSDRIAFHFYSNDNLN
jgi:hypothetical protein